MGAAHDNGRTVRVLLVDDNELNREMEAEMLEPYGFQVVQAESGIQAVELVQDVAFDIAFLDYLMPEMDGLETAERICAVCAPTGRTPVLIALTAEESDEVAQAFRDKGCQGLLTKPMDGDKLDAALERWCGVQPLASAPAGAAPRSMTADEAADIHIPGIDMEAAPAARSKTKEQYLDLLSLYHADGVKQLELWQSVAETGLKDYRIWVHALKSASANIGAMELSEQARAQEMAAKDGDYPQVQRDFPKLMAAYRTLLDAIGQRLGELSAQSAQDQITGPALETGELRRRLRHALERLEDFHPEECGQAILELLAHELPETVRGRLHEAQDRLRMYQDDDAEDILRGTIQEIGRDE